MQWLVENWIIVLFGVGMVAMHLFGHGHGKHGKKPVSKPDPEKAKLPKDDLNG